jgi:hypothetical protein
VIVGVLEIEIEGPSLAVFGLTEGFLMLFSVVQIKR